MINKSCLLSGPDGTNEKTNYLRDIWRYCWRGSGGCLRVFQGGARRVIGRSFRGNIPYQKNYINAYDFLILSLHNLYIYRFFRAAPICFSKHTKHIGKYKEIYKEHYWDRNKVESLPEELRHIFFDMCVNQGRGRAVKILQRAANAKGAELKVDGGLGPKTIAAMDGVELKRVRAYRVKYYADLVTRKPDLEKFYFGWFKRALEV